MAKRKKAYWTRIRPQSSLSYLDRTRVATQLSRRGWNSRSVTEENARRDGGEENRITPCSRARSAGEESSLELLSAVSIHCWDVSAGISVSSFDIVSFPV